MSTTTPPAKPARASHTARFTMGLKASESNRITRAAIMASPVEVSRK